MRPPAPGLRAGPLVLLGSLYVAQGLPYGFFQTGFPAILRELGLSLPQIGFTSLIALPWALKFLWAPLLDASRRRGWGRRAWILPLQALSALLLLGVAALDPAAQLPLLLGAFVLINLLSATQDIATDGLAVELLGPDERGLGNGLQVAGYRLGMVIGGGALLAAMPWIGWAGVFVGMAALIGLSSLPVLLQPEPPAPALASTAPSAWGLPQGGWPWVGLLLLYKAGDHLVTAMTRPWLVDLGWGIDEIGGLQGVVGSVAGMAGALVGGALVPRLGRREALVGFGLLQASALGLWMAAAVAGGLQPLVVTATLAEHLFGGMATAALFTCMMDACDPRRAATDYTVQASAVVLSSGVAASLSGVLAQAVGYPAHFGVGAGLAALAAGLAAVVRLPPGSAR